ncbi:MAG: TrkH family potassium uptake protein [Lachnospiraceae bacterium]|nr:TrkH family potassium uptake protein [Lachnospiraceae bacterium]
MNYSIIRNILGHVIRFEGIFMTIPILIAFLYREPSGMYFALCALGCILAGTLMVRKEVCNKSFFAKEGFVSVSLCWIVMSLIGALPFILSGAIPSFTDALFEIVSGFTTTGASILRDVESLPKCILFWRSFSHWIGGMGVLVFILAVLPLSGNSQIYLISAESPGPRFGKLVPKLQKTAFVLYAIYFGMTVIEVLLLLLGGMSLFDSLCTSFGTAGTGGFGIYNDSAGSYSPYLQNVITVFMVMFGVNFNFYFLILIRQFRNAFKMEEVRWYLIIFALATILITANLTITYGDLGYHLHHTAFQVASIMTTTGFSTVNFNDWPNFARTIMILLMFIGACAGSTGGGIKVSRFLIYLKTLRKELSVMIHPRSVKIIQSDGKAIEHETVRSVNIFLIAYILIYAISVLLVSFDNFDMVTNFTAIAATINNIGPGLELVGPASNFSIFSDFSKYVLVFDMLAGRLEIFPMLILFAPGTWKK